MKRNIIFGTIALVAGSLLAADSGPKDEVKSAAKKLADAGNYSWKSSVQNAGGRGGGGGGGGGGRGRGGFGGGPVEGKMSKDGIAVLSLTQGQNTTEAVVKGDKFAVKNQEGVWQSSTELTANAGQDQGQGGRRGRGGRGGVALRLRNFKAPAAEAEDVLGKVKELQKADGVYSGELTEDGARSLFAFGGGRGRGGGNAPTPTGVKGSAKFWVKDGVLSKYEYNVQGKMTVGQDANEIEINRTTTVEIKDVGTTTVTVPDEAKKKLS